jgi:ATP-binding cassette subfamily B (MDR/TAP) protein 1
MPQTTEAKDDEKVPFYKLFSFADKLDVTLMIIGVICAVANGLSRPLMALIFGKLINTFGYTEPLHIVHEVAKVFIIIQFQIYYYYYYYYYLRTPYCMQLAHQ